MGRIYITLSKNILLNNTLGQNVLLNGHISNCHSVKCNSSINYSPFVSPTKRERDRRASTQENLSLRVCEQQGADQHAHPHILISAFVIRLLENAGIILPFLRQGPV